jgi:hypothetical protein
MPRIIDSEVKLVFPEAKQDTATFIETATLIVDEKLTGLGMSDERLKRIELYLAAHFAALTVERGAPRRLRQGETVEEFFQDIGPGFRQTRFGQQALLLDTSGVLGDISTASGKPKAQFRVV